MLSRFFSSLSSVSAWTILFCTCLFNFCRRFCEKIFLAIGCINSHYLFSLVLMEESTFYRCDTWMLPFFSMGWFQRKLIFVSVVVAWQYMSVSRFVCLRAIVKSKKFIHMLFSYGGLSFMSACIWFMCLMMACGWVLVVSYMIRVSSTYRVYSSTFFILRSFYVYIHQL